MSQRTIQVVQHLDAVHSDVQVGGTPGCVCVSLSNNWECLCACDIRYLRSCQDVIFNADTLKHKLAQTRYWNYIYFNGPESIFHGYSWSLDVYMNYAWLQLESLNSILIILIVLEVSTQCSACQDSRLHTMRIGHALGTSCTEVTTVELELLRPVAV